MTMILTGSGTGTVGVPNRATAQNSTSGTAINFTGIPAGTKRITMMLNGVSTSGSSNLLVQIGSGSYVTSGYVGACSQTGGAFNSAVTTGLQLTYSVGAAQTSMGHAVFTLVDTSNNWVGSSVLGRSDGYTMISGTNVGLSGALDRIRITTVNGTDTFDAGSINILYE